MPDPSEIDTAAIRREFQLGVPHDHRDHVPGCFRCDLSADELDAESPEPGADCPWCGEALVPTTECPDGVCVNGHEWWAEDREGMA